MSSVTEMILGIEESALLMHGAATLKALDRVAEAQARRAQAIERLRKNPLFGSWLWWFHFGRVLWAGPTVLGRLRSAIADYHQSTERLKAA